DSSDLFNFARTMGDPNYVNPLNRLVYERAPRSPEIMQRFAAQMDRELSPFEAVPTGAVLRWVLGAVLRGRLSIVPSFLAIGKRNGAVAKARGKGLALLHK